MNLNRQAYHQMHQTSCRYSEMSWMSIEIRSDWAQISRCAAGKFASMTAISMTKWRIAVAWTAFWREEGGGDQVMEKKKPPPPRSYHLPFLSLFSRYYLYQSVALLQRCKAQPWCRPLLEAPTAAVPISTFRPSARLLRPTGLVSWFHYGARPRRTTTTKKERRSVGKTARMRRKTREHPERALVGLSEEIGRQMSGRDCSLGTMGTWILMTQL